MNPVFFFGKLLNTRILTVYINAKIQLINLIGFPTIKLTASSSNMFSNTASNITDRDSEIVHPASKPVEDQTDARSSYLQSASTQSAASVGGFSLNSSARCNSNPRIQPPCGNSAGLHLCHKPTPYVGRWIFKVPDYSGYDERYATFRTWPKSHPIRPDALTRAGFLYTGEGDKVTCPWCKISLIEWETYDVPMDEHKRHAPTCDFVKMIMPKNSFFSPTS